MTAKKPQERTKILFIRGLPQEERNEFKAQCARKHLSVQDGILSLIRMIVYQRKGKHEEETQ